MLRIDEIKIYQDLDDKQLYKIALKKANIKSDDLLSIKIVKKAIDSRDKNNVHYVYSFDVEVKDEKKYPRIKKVVYKQDQIIVNRVSNYQPIIVGSGPAGLFCALELVQQGFKPIIIEQGKAVDERIKDVNEARQQGIINPKSNVQFGEGGAGTFSDGKLTTNVNSPYIKKILDTFVCFGAEKEISYLAKPHLGTDKLVEIVKNIRNYIISKGGQYYFETQFIDYHYQDKLLEVVTDKQNFLTDALVLAIGHSGFDTFKMLQKKNIKLQRKIFAIGLRIEHQQNMINESQYGTITKLKLPPADYKLVYHGDRSCYSFCMCPGGEVIASSSEKEAIVTNGMSNFAREKENANSALLVNVLPSDLSGDDPLAGMYLQRELEHQAFVYGGSNYNAPVQRVKDFEDNIPSVKIGSVVPSYKPGYTLTNLNDFLPPYISQTIRDALPYFDKKIKGFNKPDAILTAIETRSSSPVTIVRDATYQCSQPLIYPCGEGAGYAGGITTAAIDGIKVARAIMERKD